MLEQVDTDLWTGDGPTVRFLGAFPYPTRMAVVRLRDGALWVWSPAPLEGDLRAKVETLGPVRHLVAPNKLHHLFLGDWARAFPEARLHGAPGLARRRPDLAFHSELDDVPQPEWARDLDQVVVRGSVFMEEVVFFHRRSRAALVADLIQRFEPGSIGGWREVLMRADSLVGPEGSTPREWRATFWRRRAARAGRDRILGWDPQRLIVAHGACAGHGARSVSARALRWMG